MLTYMVPFIALLLEESGARRGGSYTHSYGGGYHSYGGYGYNHSYGGYTYTHSSGCYSNGRPVKCGAIIPIAIAIFGCICCVAVFGIFAKICGWG